MPRVTAITPQKRSGRYNVYLDGRFALGLDEMTLARSGLRIGQELSGDDLAPWQAAGELGKLYDKALRFLAVRPRSVKEMRDYLHKKISSVKSLIPEETAEGVVRDIVVRLKKSGLVDDEKFVQWWLEQRQGARRPKGQFVIKNELRQKGIAAEIVEDVLSRSALVAESELARKAAAKKAKIYKKYPFREARQKMAQYLLRQGFSWPVVKEALILVDITGKSA